MRQQVTDGCPAFSSGCPYPLATEGGPEEEKAALRAVKECPAFSEGCPFKGTSDSVQGLATKMAEMPSSHVGGGDVAPQVASALRAVHRVSDRIKEDHMGGAACPVFAVGGCPFKGAARTSSGKSLVEELDLRLWEDAPDEPEGVEDAAMDEQLSKYLKEGTKVAHREAENVKFVRRFIKGNITEELYVRMLADLYFVYEALEAGLRRHAAHPVLQPLYFPKELDRAPALAADLRFFRGMLWRFTTRPSKAALDYVQHLNRLAEGGEATVALLLSHAYTRYLGDLSGGRVLARAAKRALAGRLRPGGEGLSFYAFPEVDSPKAFKDRYRNALDELPVSAPMADALVGEANLAFVLNTRLFQQLDLEAGLREQVDPVERLMGSLSDMGAPARNASAEAAKAAGCPFAALAAAGAPVPASHAKFVGGGKDEAKGKEAGRCPLPFRLLHDPMCVTRDVGAAAWVAAILAVLYVLALGRAGV